MDTMDLVTRLTLILFVFSDEMVGSDWYLRFTIRAVAVIGLVAPPLHRNRIYWSALDSFLYREFVPRIAHNSRERAANNC